MLLPVCDEIKRSRNFDNLSTEIGKDGSAIRPRAVLVDFGHAVKANTQTIYEGGYICCPPELLDAIAAKSEEQNSGLQTSGSPKFGGILVEKFKLNNFNTMDSNRIQAIQAVS